MTGKNESATATAEVETTGTDMVQASPLALEMLDQLNVQPADPNELALVIAQRLALAETPESLDQIAAGTSWEDHLGEPFILNRVWFPPSGYEGGLPVYVLCEAAHADTGEFVVLSTGATGVVIAVARALQKGWLDRPWKMVRADKATSNGYYPYRLVQA